MTAIAWWWLIGILLVGNVAFYYSIYLIKKKLLETKGDKIATLVLGTVLSIAVFVVMGLRSSVDYTDNVVGPVHLEMRLITGDLICGRYMLPIDDPSVSIGTHRGSYYATYIERETLFWGSFAIRTRNTLKNGVVDVNIVNQC